MKHPTLTGNDIATAEFGLMHAIAWCKKQGRGAYWKREVAKYQTVLHKLTTINELAYPYGQAPDDASPPPYGDERIMRVDIPTIRRTQKAAKKFNKDNGA